MLRREGKFDGIAGIALVRGLVAHEALELIHWKPDELLSPILHDATARVIEKLIQEGRQPSDSVMGGLKEIEADILTVLDAYKRRIIPITRKWTLLGTEVPVYWELSEDVHLSSHIDALFLTDEGKPIIWDWKWRKDPMAISDLSRNLQLACYFACLVSGMVELNHTPKDWQAIDTMSGWTFPTEVVTPDVAWIDLPSLKPYTRKTTAKDDEGKETVYTKGDDRPLSRTIRTIKHHPDQIETIKAFALQRANLIRNNVPMYIPQGCSHCECESWCPRFDIPQNT